MIANAPYIEFVRDFIAKKGAQPFHFIRESLVDPVTGIGVSKAKWYIKDAIDPVIGRLVDSGIILRKFEVPKCE